MRQLVGAAALVIVLAPVTGCGGGDSTDSDGPGGSPSATSSGPAAVPRAQLTQAELIPAAFPLDQVPTVDGKVISAFDTGVAINAELERAAAFTEAVARLMAAGYEAIRFEEADAEARFTGRGLTIELIVVADGPSNAGVSYSIS